MIFLHLIIAHLLGDFVFQSNDLILKKYKSWKGILEHVSIITAISILLLFPLLQNPEIWTLIGLIALAHFTQDCLKIAYEIRYNSARSTLPFFLDQIFHVGLIAVLSMQLNDLPMIPLPAWFLSFYNAEPLAVYFIGGIMVSYSYDILLYQFARQKNKKITQYKPNVPNMLKRIILFTGAYLLIFAGSFM